MNRTDTGKDTRLLVLSGGCMSRNTCRAGSFQGGNEAGKRNRHQQRVQDLKIVSVQVSVQSMTEALQRISRHRDVPGEDARVVSREAARVESRRETQSRDTKCLPDLPSLTILPGHRRHHPGRKIHVHVPGFTSTIFLDDDATPRLSLSLPRCSSTPSSSGAKLFFWLSTTDSLLGEGDLAGTRAISRSPGQIQADGDETREPGSPVSWTRRQRTRRQRTSDDDRRGTEHVPSTTIYLPGPFPTRGASSRTRIRETEGQSRLAGRGRLPECDRNAVARLYLGCKHRHFSCEMTLRQSEQLVHGYRAHRGRRGGVARADPRVIKCRAGHGDPGSPRKTLIENWRR